MRYKFTIQERDGGWVYFLSFGKDTPTDVSDVIEYSDNSVSAEDFRGVRHSVYTKNGKIVSIHLHEPLGILPYLDPDRPETIRMPVMQAIMFGNPPMPTLLLKFKEEPPDTGTAYAISPHVYLAFHGNELAHLHVFDVYKNIPDVN